MRGVSYRSGFLTQLRHFMGLEFSTGEIFASTGEKTFPTGEIFRPTGEKVCSTGEKKFSINDLSIKGTTALENS